MLINIKKHQLDHRKKMLQKPVIIAHEELIIFAYITKRPQNGNPVDKDILEAFSK